jgi:Glyoxalase/Bleomycin resistance protein/Dioxygenase superfamily
VWPYGIHDEEEAGMTDVEAVVQRTLGSMSSIARIRVSPGLAGYRAIKRGRLRSRNWRYDVRENLRRPLVTPTLRGVHHLALCTDDMKATIDFYVDVLGMPLVHVMEGAAWSWHWPRQSRQSTL